MICTLPPAASIVDGASKGRGADGALVDFRFDYGGTCSTLVISRECHKSLLAAPSKNIREICKFSTSVSIH